MRRIALISTVILALAAVSVPLQGEASVPTAAVLYFDNDTGDKNYDYLGKGLADMVITDLAVVPGLQVVEREKLEALLKELKLQRSKYFDPKTTQEIGKGVGAEYAITGSFTSLIPNIRLDVRVIRIATGQVLKATKVTGQHEKFFELQQQLIRQLVDGLSLVLSSSEQSRLDNSVVANRINDLNTAVQYAKALDLRDKGDLQSASLQMQQLMTSTPSFALARSRYLQIMRDLFAAKDAHTQSLSKSAETLQTNLKRRLKELTPVKTESRWNCDHRLTFCPGTITAIPNPEGKTCKSLCEDYFGSRFLIGRYYLKRIANNLDKPIQRYMPDVLEFINNQEALIDDIRDYRKSRPLADLPDWRGYFDFPHGRMLQKLALDIGVRTHPIGEIRLDFELRRLAMFLSFGPAFDDEIDNLIFSPSIVNPDYDAARYSSCFFKLDSSFANKSLRALEQALAVFAKNPETLDGRSFHARIVTLNQYADVLLLLGKPEEAISKLQIILIQHPNYTYFAEIERKIRMVLAGKLGPTCQSIF